MNTSKKKIISKKVYDPPLDYNIKNAVLTLNENGIETFESCQGGRGHAYKEPTVRFEGDKAEGFKAIAIAMQNGLRVSELRRVWDIIDGEPVGPFWELIFIR